MVEVMVIGGGPAGVTAALRARELGAHVALIERGVLGGTCTNDGCVPTRVLAKAARLVRDAAQFEQYGLNAPSPAIDFGRVIARAQQVVYQIHDKKQLINHLQTVGVELYHEVGNARFIDAHTVELVDDGRQISADHIIIAAGGHARRLNFPGAEYTLAHSDVWSMTTLPQSIVIVGSGATGCQLASVMDAFGAQVTLMDVAQRVLPTEDASISGAIGAAFYLNGITVITGINGIDRIDRRADGRLDFAYIHDDEPRTITTDAVLLSVGWPSNADGLNLAAAGVETKGAYISTDDELRTSAPHIYAIGDINGRMMLVQSAHHQARAAVENALLNARRQDTRKLVPHGGFTDPEYAAVGLTEEAARKNHSIAIATVPYEGMDRAVIDGRIDGFCKLIVDRETRVILGAHVVGEQAVEIVQVLAVAMAGNILIEMLADLEFAYPTFAAIIGVAARQIALELRVVPVVPRWSDVDVQRPAEWERRA